MKFIKIKKIGLSALALTSSLFLACSSFGTAEGINEGYEEATITPRSAITEQEPNNSTSNATDISSLTYKDAVTGFISSSTDVDYYKYKTTSSQSGKIKLILNNPSSSYNYGVAIYKGSTATVCGNVDTAGNKTIMFSVSPNTTYYIKVYSANSKYTAITPYTFTLQHYSASENIYGSLSWTYPLPSKYTTIATHQGDPGYTADGKPHSGIDIPADNGTSIYNSADGVVHDCGYEATKGNYVIMKTNYYEPTSAHSRGQLYVRYLHMNELPNVSNKQTVSKGTVLGYVGSTGLSYEPYRNHLHIDINNIEVTGGTTIRNNPQNCLNPELFYPRVNFTSSAFEEGNRDTEEALSESENWHYTSVSKVISDQVDQDEYDRFIEMYSGTADFNIVNFVKHFNYPKELFVDIVEQYDLEWYDTNVIYSDDEAQIAEFFGLDN